MHLHSIIHTTLREGTKLKCVELYSFTIKIDVSSCNINSYDIQLFGLLHFPLSCRNMPHVSSSWYLLMIYIVLLLFDRGDSSFSSSCSIWCSSILSEGICGMFTSWGPLWFACVFWSQSYYLSTYIFSRSSSPLSSLCSTQGFSLSKFTACLRLLDSVSWF